MLDLLIFFNLLEPITNGTNDAHEKRRLNNPAGLNKLATVHRSCEKATSKKEEEKRVATGPEATTTDAIVVLHYSTAWRQRDRKIHIRQAFFSVLLFFGGGGKGEKAVMGSKRDRTNHVDTQ